MSICLRSDQKSAFNNGNFTQDKKKMKFVIPKSINYNIKIDPKEESSGKCYMRAEFIHSKYNNVHYPWIQLECYQMKKYKKTNRLTILHIRNKSISTHNKQTIIYSHGNNEDLGTIYPLLVDLVSQLKVKRFYLDKYNRI